MADFDDVIRFAGTEQGLCTVAMTRSDGSVHSSVVNAAPFRHPVTGDRAVAFVVRGDAVKVGLVEAAGRVSVTFRRDWRWVGVEGPADIIGPDHPATGDNAVDVPTLLREVFIAAGGSHDDWAEYDRVMEQERRTAILVRPERILGIP